MPSSIIEKNINKPTYRKAVLEMLVEASKRLDGLRDLVESQHGASNSDMNTSGRPMIEPVRKTKITNQNIYIRSPIKTRQKTNGTNRNICLRSPIKTRQKTKMGKM